MNQALAFNDVSIDRRPVTVSAPRAWDGIGQALRAAFRDHRDPPGEFADVLGRLRACD